MCGQSTVTVVYVPVLRSGVVNSPRPFTMRKPPFGHHIVRVIAQDDEPWLYPRNESGSIINYYFAVTLVY